MWKQMKKSLFLFFLTGLCRAAAQQLIWETLDTLPPAGQVEFGNGVFLTPNEESLVVTSSSGTVASVKARTGGLEWQYTPPPNKGLPWDCRSGMAFTTDNAPSPYMVYSIVDTTSEMRFSRVIALSLEGSELWRSDKIVGEAVGTPLISDNGNYVFLNVNQNDSFGRFTILSNEMGGSKFFDQLVTLCPFAPPGIFHNPVQGYYNGGGGNTNDIVLWSCDARSPFVDFGGIYAFQFPVNFADDAQEIAITFLGDEPGDFWGRTPPVLTNGGLSAYWTSKTSTYYAWVGESGLVQNQFDRDPTASVGFDRPSFQRQPVYAPPALSSDPLEPMVFGGTASEQFVRMSYDYSESLVIDTSTIVRAKAIVSPADDFVYYVESGGIIHQANVLDLSDAWNATVSADTVGEIALDSTGLFLYVGDSSGTIRAFLVGDATLPPTTGPTETPGVTTQPSDLPSGHPSSVPSTIPSAMPSKVPSSEPSIKPSALPSGHPSSVPSTIPSAMPSKVSSANPSSVPSTERSSEPSESPSDSPTTEPSISPSTGPPVLQCEGYSSTCVFANDCCSNRCVLGTCQKAIVTQKTKIGGGRGGAGGGEGKERSGGDRGSNGGRRRR